MTKCNRCKVNLTDDKFKVKRCGNLQKICIECNAKNLIWKRSTNEVFQCPSCEYNAHDNGNLQRHINSVHLKQQNHQCPTCNSKFSQNIDLQRHINSVHLKIKVYLCDQCEYKTASQYSLPSHIKAVHLKEQHYVCEQCDSKFARNSHLQTHINSVHLKIKDYQCTQCEYKCSLNGNLQNHIKRCTGDVNCSAGEYKILKLLEKLNYEKDVDFLHNSSFWNIKDKGLLRWDFVINHTSDNPKVLEYDGRQHLVPVSFGGCSIEKARENFENSQRRDKIKNDYCKENNIPILRISYLDIDNMEPLISEFLVR